jgi:glutathione S-transferase
MKLYQTPTSPFVRIVRAAAHRKGLSDAIELVNRTDDGIEEVNPLNKVPALTTDDGEVLIEARLICRHFDEIGDGEALYPVDATERRRVLQREATVLGLMDAVVLRRMETRREESERSQWWEERQQRKIDHVLDLIEKNAADYTAPGSIVPISLCCALDFMDRHAANVTGLDWRNDHTKLAAWYESFSADPAMVATDVK